MRGTMHAGMPTAPVRLNAMVLGHIRHICLLYQCMKNISVKIKWMEKDWNYFI